MGLPAFLMRAGFMIPEPGARFGEAKCQVPAAPSQGQGCLNSWLFNRQCAKPRSFTTMGRSASANPQAARQGLASGVIAQFEAALPFASEIHRA